ncbi:MAG: polyprenyl diphosphate synthase [Steroidobacteraceae bacterium]
MIEDLKHDAGQRMQKCVETFQADLRKLRTGRAHPSLVENMKVDYYGSDVPLKQVANVAVEDARTLTISPWEKNMVGAIEKAIHKSDLGLTPMTAGAVIRLPLPPLTEERRRDITKVVRADAENARVAIRNVRRDVIGDIKEALKAKLLSQDEEKRGGGRDPEVIQRMITISIRSSAPKKKEIMQVQRCRHAIAAAYRDHHGRERPRGRRRAACRAISATRMDLGRCVCVSNRRHARHRLRRRRYSRLKNWRRPVEEVGSLMSLFLDSLDREVAALDRDGVRITFIGDRHTLSVKLQSRMAEAEHLTKDNVRLRLQLAISYGGRWDILNAVRHVARAALSGSIGVEQIDEAVFTAALALSDVPDPDLFIRTGGEHRISNFLLWNLAYTELYFTDVLWPDFKQADFEAALTAFGARERRFGRTGEQSGAA